MCSTLNVAFDNFVLNNEHLFFGIQFGLFDYQLDQFTLSFAGGAQLRRCQYIHTDLEFVGRNVLQNKTKLLPIQTHSVIIADYYYL